MPRRLFKRAHSSEDAASSRSSDSSSLSLMLPPPPPPFNSPEEGCHAQMTSAKRREGFLPISEGVREILVLHFYVYYCIS